MLPDHQSLSQILSALYEAPLDPSCWEAFLRLTAKAAGAEAAALLLLDFNDAQSLVSRQWGLNPEATERYEQHYGRLDVWLPKVASATDWLRTSEQLVPVAELERTEFYNDLLLPYEIPHAMFGMIERGSLRVANLSVYRGFRAGAFEEPGLDVIRFLRPHIKQAYRLHSQLASAQGRSAGLLAALDKLPTGVILLDPRKQIVTMNRAAEVLIAKNSGLLGSRGVLRAEHPPESARLEKLIAEAVMTSKAGGLESAGAMTITRRDLPALHLLVSPVRGIDLDDAHPITAIVFVSDPTQRARPARDTLRALFGLTPAECRLAMLLADGQTPRAIAETVGVSQNTLKSQLASVYRKTETSRQSQLVRLLTQIAAGPT